MTFIGNHFKLGPTKIGFRQAVLIGVIGGFSSHLWATPAPPAPVSYAQPAHVAQHQNSLLVRASPRGYITTGSINGIPVSFMVDTGASHVAVPAAFALQAGIRCDRYGQSSTANGTTRSCSGKASEITFGPFRLTDVDVTVLPNSERALLGMNALRSFNMVWHGDAIRITPMDSTGRNLVAAKLGDGKRGDSINYGSALLSGLIAGLAVFAWSKWRGSGRTLPRPTPGPWPKRAPSPNLKDFRHERPAAAAPRAQPPGTLHSRLLLACGGDKARMARLIEYETRKAPLISDAEAAKRALERIERDRR